LITHNLLTRTPETVQKIKNKVKMGHNTGISKIILVKGGHGLENVSLNLCSVTISSVRTIGLPAPLFL
jgi:hypothetical protein